MPQPGEDIAELPDRGWRQGTLIPLELLLAGTTFPHRSPLRGDELAILISHDCDIAHKWYSAEPFIEFLIARPISEDKDQGQLTGKHPRLFQLEYPHDPRHKLFGVDINDKHRVFRQLLVGKQPVGALDPDVVRLVTSWVAKRYTRPALPDEFNERCRPARDKIANLLKKKGQLITNLLLALEPEDEELEEGENYTLMLVACCTRETWEHTSKNIEAIALVSSISDHLRNCKGIDVREPLLRSEHQMTLEDVRELIRWDYDYLSYRSGDLEHPIDLTK
ncbi:MAG TPA: hypothetical protein VK604_27465 [Bryobacteraceae bacterium]|nr:hypothetical protein [Bryobacteraceae bacterium]